MSSSLREEGGNISTVDILVVGYTQDIWKYKNPIRTLQ